MSFRLHRRLSGWAAVALLAGLRAEAQYRTVVEQPRWLTLRPDHASVGGMAQYYEQTSTVEGSVPSVHKRLYVGPLVGLGLSGAIYHPNLFDYRINADGAMAWTDEEFTGLSSYSSTQWRYIGSVVGNAKLFNGKPLNGDLNGSYSQTYQDYDFFNRIYLDRWRYGAGAHYLTGPLSFNGSAYHETQDSTGYGTPLVSDTTTATADASYSRGWGSSTVGAAWNDYTRNDFGVQGRGQDYLFSASDSADFGNRKQYHSLVNLSLNRLDNSTYPSDLYYASGNLRTEHTDRLESQYTVNYSRNEMAGTETDNLNGIASLRHRLYDSLTSQLNLQGYSYSASGESGWQHAKQFGGGPGFSYVKKLSASSSLLAYETLTLLHTDVESSGGIIPVVDEQHFFSAEPAGDSFTLRQPNVIESTIVITDPSHLPPGGYRPGIDYLVIPNGQLTTIRRPVGSFMTNNAVLVSYDFDASPSGGYNTLNNACGLRLDFFDHLWSVFTRYNINQNYGSADLPVNNLTDWVIGTEANWKFLRAGAEYEIYDSNLSPFTALRFYQNLTFYPKDRSSISLNCTEAFYNYEAAARRDEYYTATLRYNRRLTRHLGLNVELGASQRKGPGVDQTLAVFRPQLNYAAGKFSATIGYDFGYDEYAHTQERVRNMGFIRFRKEF